MKFLKKLFLVAFLGLFIFLAQGILDTQSAQAEMYKFSFNGDRVNGSFIFDDTVPGTVFIHEDLFSDAFHEYDGAVVKYDINIEDEIVEKGSKNPDPTIHDHNRPRTIVNRVRPEFLPIFYQQDPTLKDQLDASNEDDFVIYIPENDRQSIYALVLRFRYPAGTFPSLDQPKTVPSNALMSVHPYWNFPISMGPVEVEKEVNTSIEKIN